MPVPQEKLDLVALSRAEYETIVQKIEREPNDVELGLFGSLWSEHCGYKHSKPLLRLFPTSGDAVRVKAGQENAGVVDIGDGLSVVFKAESHNHPSAVEPYQGAATGVGGIIRDILAMGARPIALLNSLRFGPLTEPRNRYLFNGVVSGISGYGNCIGIPDVGGEIMFAPEYSGNPLVNAMCVGLLPEGALMRAAAATPGNTLMIVGNATGRDGIHGASGLASRVFGRGGDGAEEGEEEREMRPTVQVGDPFLEKVLVEACLEAAKSGHLEGLQDLGAAGLTSSVMESAARGGTGVEIDVALVPRREPGMTAYEVMLSESQERMLLIVKKGREAKVAAIFERWDLPVTAIGRVTKDGRARIFDNGTLVADLDVDTLVEAPQYRPGGQRPGYLDIVHSLPYPSAPPLSDAGSVLKRLLSSPNIASKRAVYRQYDHEVQTNTMVKPGAADAAVLRVRGTRKALALAIDGNGRFPYLEPFVGGAMAVAEACRNVACAGGRPLAITDCLNFGDPTKPEVYYQLEECIKGMAAACEALGVPVVSGNVSLFNESQGRSVYPTPVVGAVGLLDHADARLTMAFQNEGDVILLLGVHSGAAETLAGSEYLAHVHDQVIGRPAIDLTAEAKLQSLLVSLAHSHLLQSAHDCADGGLAVTVAESAIAGHMGVRCAIPPFGPSVPEPNAPQPSAPQPGEPQDQWTTGDERWDAALFGEAPSRVVVSCASDKLETVVRLAEDADVPVQRIGTAGGARLTFEGLLDEPLSDLADAYDNGLERALS